MPIIIILIIIFGFVISKAGEKAKLVGTILVVGLLLGIPYIIKWWDESNANPFDYARITEVDYRAEVVDEQGSNGKVIVKERLVFDIHAASQDNLFWELWRDLPEEYIDGVKVDYKVNYVKEIKENGQEVIYQESPKLYWYDNDYINTARGLGPGKWFHSKGPYDGEHNFECVLFYVDGLYRETVVFEIEYEMYNASLRYLDSSELYLSLYSGDSIKYLKSFKGQILFPNDKMPSKGNYDAYTYGTNSHTFDFIESSETNPGYNTFSFELNKSQLKFRPYNQYIEFALVSHGDDKHKFTQYALANDFSQTEVLTKTNKEQAKYEALPRDYMILKSIAFILLSAGTFLIVKSTSNIEKKIKKKYTFYEPAMKMDYFRDIPSELDPNFAAALVFCKHKTLTEDIEDGYAAVMLSLVRKGYIELEKINNDKDWESRNNVKIVVKYKPIQQQTLINKDGLVPNAQPQSQPIYQHAQATPKKACPKCGNLNAEGNIKCIFCSAPFNSDSANNSESANASIFPNIFQTNTSQVNQSQPIPEQQAYQEEIIANIKALTPTEEQYFNLILRHSSGTEISLNRFQEKVSEDYQNTTSFVKNIKNIVKDIGVSQGYYQQANFKKAKEEVTGKTYTYGLFGGLLLTLGNYASYQTRFDLIFGSITFLAIGFIYGAIHLNKLAKKSILLTQFGEDEYAKWRGLYNFLNSETLMNERTAIEVYIWEQYLIYATAFGISEKVIAALKVRATEMNLNTSPVLRNSYYRSRSFHSSSRSFRTATRTASYTSRSGGYGGYGGGGRGGGGGGGGH